MWSFYWRECAFTHGFMCCLRIDLWKRSFNLKDLRLDLKMLCPKSAVQGHLCSLGVEQEPSTCISSSSSLPSAPVLDRICTNTLTFNWGLLQSRDTLESFLWGQGRAWSSSSWCYSAESPFRPRCQSQQTANHRTTMLMMLTKPLPPFSGNSCAPPQLLLINYHSDVPSQSPSWYPQRHTLFSAQTQALKE